MGTYDRPGMILQASPGHRAKLRDGKFQTSSRRFRRVLASSRRQGRAGQQQIHLGIYI